MPNTLSQHRRILQATIANARQHAQSTQGGAIPDNYRLIMQSIFNDGRESAHELRNFIRQRCETYAPMVEATVKIFLQPLRLASRNTASDADDRKLAEAEKFIALLTPQARALFNIGALVSEINSVDDLARIDEALNLLVPLEREFSPGGSVYPTPWSD